MMLWEGVRPLSNLFPAYSSEFIQVSEVFHRELAETYPHIDLFEEYGRMNIWLRANPRRRKTQRGIPRFIVNWLMKVPKPSGEIRVGANPFQNVHVRPEALARARERK